MRSNCLAGVCNNWLEKSLFFLSVERNDRFCAISRVSFCVGLYIDAEHSLL